MLVDLLVEVQTEEGRITGLLVDTHLVPQQGSPQFGMTPDKRLVQGPQQVQLTLFALIAHQGGFIFCPIGAVQPLFTEPLPQPTGVEPPLELGDL